MADTFSVIPSKPLHHLLYQRHGWDFAKFSGNGYFSSTLPEFIVTEEGMPISAEIRIHIHGSSLDALDGRLVAKTRSNATGQWYVGGLNPIFRYDVVCRLDGYNDLVYSNVQPKI